MARQAHISGRCRGALVALGLLLCAVQAQSAERLVHRFGAESGLDVDTVGEVVVGTDGALWFATALGMRRYDGHRIEPVVPGAPPLAFFHVAPRPEGGVYAISEAKEVYAITRAGRRKLTDLPQDGPVRNLAVDGQGRLWLIQGGVFHRREGPGAWSQPMRHLMKDGERGARLEADGDTVVACTTEGVLAARGHRAERLVDQAFGEPVMDAVSLDDGSIVTLDFVGTIRVWQGGVLRSETRGPGRGIDLQLRRDTIWISWDHALGWMRPGQPVASQSAPAGGKFTVGPDGVLLQGVFAGLLAWPDPDTVNWGVEDGSPGTAVRFLHVGADDRLWIGTWSGGGVLGPDGFERMPLVDYPAFPGRPSPVRGEICPGLDGAGWFSQGWNGRAGGIASWRPGQAATFAREDGTGSRCDVDENGVVWMAAAGQLWRHDGAGLEGPVALPLEASLVDVAGSRLWVNRGGEMCVAERGEVARAEAWTCVDIGAHGARYAVGVVEVDGKVLIATDGGGLLRYQRGELEPHPRSDAAFGSRALQDIAVSPRGGIWVVGHGVLDRVRPDDLSLLERLGRPQGVGRTSASAIAEYKDGRVFLATSTGLIEVPAAARQLPPAPPPPRLVAVDLDGVAQPLGTRFELPAPPNRLGLQVAALTLREPGDLSFRVRIDGTAPREVADGSLQLVDLPSGTHTLSLQSGLPGRGWSDPIRVSVQVATPWWRTPWAMALALLTALGAIYAAYRTRVAWLLARERQRTGIAMDLHDELGSGLGSIRLLASVLDREDLAPPTRRDLVARIHRVAGELHGSVQELVGSLRPGGATVGALVDRLGERARDLFADPELEVRVVASDRLATRSLSLPARRELERIGAEALHNAAKHSGCGRVTVGVRERGRRMQLWVDDDGCGFDADAQEGRGLGMQSMRTRAERIGARVDIRSRPDQGTTVEVSFDPDARDRRRRP